MRDASAYSPLIAWAGGAIAVEIDRAVFALDAVLATAYKFSDRLYVFVQSHPDRNDRWLAVIRSKDPSAEPERLAGEFSNDLVDQQLRVRLNAEFGGLRTVIAAQAFSEGNLLDPDRDQCDCVSDPRQIGTPR